MTVQKREIFTSWDSIICTYSQLDIPPLMEQQQIMIMLLLYNNYLVKDRVFGLNLPSVLKIYLYSIMFLNYFTIYTISTHPKYHIFSIP